MKTLDMTIDRAFTAGQHTERIGARNRDVLSRCKNMRPTEWGAAFNKEAATPILSPPTTVWPFPQLIKGRAATMLADEDAISDVNETTGALTLRKIFNSAECVSPTSTTIVTNGTFTGAATSWTLGTGWSYASNRLVGTGVTGGALATQSLLNQAGLKVEAGALYRVSVEIVSTDLVGSLFFQLGDAMSDYFSTVGVHTFDLYTNATGALSLTSTDSFTGTVDNIVVKKIAEATIPTGGGSWHFADFGKVWFLVKQNCVVASVPYYSNFRLVAFTNAVNDFTCNAAENFANRLFIGGITAPTLLASVDWEELWETWIKSSSEWSDDLTHADLVLTPSTIVYSTRVGGDVYWPFVMEMAMLGLPYTTDAEILADLKANYLDWIRKGEIGFVPLPHQGEILMLKRLGNMVVAYCSDGVSIITPNEDKGFRADIRHPVGLASRSAVSGDLTRHVFLDANSVLYAINADGTLERLCGVGTFDTMITNEAAHPIIGSYDPEEGENYLCTDQQGFIRTRTGIGEISKLPTSLVMMAGELAAGAMVDLADGDIDIITEAFDMGLHALKTIHTISVGYSDIADLRVQVLYKMDTSATWKTVPSIAVNADRVTVPITTAHDFKLKLTGTPGPDAKIDYVGIQFQVSDKRNIRGQYGT